MLLCFGFPLSVPPQGGWQDLLDEQRVLGDTLHGFQQEAAHGHTLRLGVGHTFLKPNKQTMFHMLQQGATEPEGINCQLPAYKHLTNVLNKNKNKKN